MTHLYTSTCLRTTALPRYTVRSTARQLHSSQACSKQHRLPAAYYRGGTSKAVIFRASDLPADKNQWPGIFRKVLGSPDPNGRQLDGMGGGLSSVSKVCVVGRSADSEADVDYTFAAIGIKNDEVDFSSNCGNMSAAIGPFAIDQGMIERSDGPATVRIMNTNTGKRIDATFDVKDNEAVVDGDLAIDGVAGTAARIRLAFIDPAGAKTGKTLPTGSSVDKIDGIDVSCIDVGNPCVFVRATDLKVRGSILADEIENNATLLEQLESIRTQAAERMGIRASGSLPKIGMVSSPEDHIVQSGKFLGSNDCDLIVRAMSVGQPHKAVPITVAMALAVAAKLPGSVVNLCTAKERADPDGITIGHNSGSILVGANILEGGSVKEATVFRTARRLMDGNIYYQQH